MSDLKIFDNARVLVIGDVMLDRYWWGRVDRISPEAPVPIVKLERTTAVPGGAANVAANVVALGGKAMLIGCIGDDDEGSELREALHDKHLPSEHLIVIRGRKTSVKTRIVAHQQQVARVDSELTAEIGETDASRVSKGVRNLLSGADVVVISDYAKGFLSVAVLREIISDCKAADKSILVDPKGKDFSKYLGASVLTPNRKEAAEACKLDESSPALVDHAGKQLLAEFALEAVLITESENGMTLFERGRNSVHFYAAARQVYDVTGAGDTVIACAGVAVAAGLDLVEAARLANIAAGLSVQRVGASSVTRAELEAALVEHQ